ncbi:uncharacterized protein PpBr36_10624 [Pyricularia pennisetigena]|uniref:uncharacterized protein n=1 Tax=Pyricularia pennisetigena TaxID=1578925 RepID=UPI00115315DF|nr:uncharacterized protein PpBr36_10624 [Pyricularia pennisetigena]TLS21235.1 hypothetical protein PpBr36_10624 [Pyricularia pennisetigena]
MAVPNAGSIVTNTDYNREETALCLALVVFSLWAIIRSAKLSARPTRVLQRSVLGWTKNVINTAYAVSSTGALALLFFGAPSDGDGLILQTLLLCFSSWCVLITSRQEHLKTVRPSHFLQASLVLSLPIELFWLKELGLQKEPLLSTMGYIHAVLLAVMVFLESCDKRKLLLLQKDRELSREATSGIFRQRFLGYLNGLLKKAYRTTLTPSDVEGVDETLLSDDASVRFQEYWSQPRNQTGKNSLLRSLVVVLWKDLCTPVLPRFLGLVATLSQPLLISTILAHIQNPDGSTSGFDKFTILAAFAVDFTLAAVFNAWYLHETARYTVRVRSVVISALYEKALRTHGQGADLGSATVLMNVDLDKVLEGIRWMHEVWAVPLVVGLCLYGLNTTIGGVFIVPLIVLLLATAMSWDLGDSLTWRNLEWMGKTEKRITTLAKIASSIKEIRMLGFTELIQSSMIKHRVDELLAYRSTSTLWIYVVGIGYAMFPILVFATFVPVALASLYGAGVTFNAEAMFTSLSVLKLMAAQTLPFLQMLSTFQGAQASLARMQAYLSGRDDISETNGQATMVLAEAEPGSKHPKLCKEPDAEGFELQVSFAKPSGKEAFQVKAADFGFRKGQPLLHDINLSIYEGSFVMIVGKVGSGKSLLLQSLVGEMAVLGGSARRRSPQASLCSQQPWLRNVSVRDNIVGEARFDAEWYGAVTSACGLEQDFRELPQGDASPAGSSGMNLSGGQKNRVSLARAVYARRPVVMVDDVLSGLDKTTENLVFSRVFGRDGLLRQMKCTVVLVTHSVRWAAHADKVVVVSDGRVVADGPYRSLIKVPGLWEMYCSTDKTSSADTMVERDDDGPEALQEMTVVENESGDDVSVDVPKPEDQNGSHEPQGDSDYRRKGHAGTLNYYLKGYGKTYLATYVVLAVATYTLSAVHFIYVKKLIQDSSSVVLFARSISVFTGISGFAFSIVGVYLTFFFRMFSPRSGLKLHARQLGVYLKAKFPALVSKDAGEIINLFSQDIVIVDRLLPLLVLNISTGFLEQSKNVLLLVLATPPIILMIPFPIAIGYLVQHFYLRTSRQLRHLDLEAKAPLCSNFIETLAGSATIRVFGWSADFKRRNKRLQDKSQAPYYLLQDMAIWLALVLDLIVAGIISVLVGLGLFLASKTDPGNLALALIGVIDLGSSIRILVLAWTEVETAMSAVTRIRRFLDGTSQEPVRCSDAAAPQWPEHGAVQFRDVSASYSLDRSGTPTLHDINLDVGAGDKVAICGRTGSGKSSLVATLLGLTNQLGGEILIDGISTAAVAPGRLRRSIVTLTQDPFFLDGTVKENLMPWKGMGETPGGDDYISDEDVTRALQTCNLGDKLQTAAAADGSALNLSMAVVENLLSEGEKQLFCLARAILHPRKLVILDEATSRVDANTDALMQKVLRTEFADRTILAISHSIANIMDFDRIVVMDGGRVAEIGSPTALMLKEDSLFSALAKAQGNIKAVGSLI